MQHVDFEEYKEFLKLINNESNAIIVVEGKNDRKALEFWGIKLPIVTYRGPTFAFVEYVEAKFTTMKEIILLLDCDKEGKQLKKQLKQAFSEKGFKVNTYFWVKLMSFGVTYVEGLISEKFLEAVKYYEMA